MERVVTCPHCGDEHHCFEEVQDEYSSFMCFNCGFMSDTRFTKENEEKLQRDSTLLVNKLKYYDEERNIWWFPAIVNMGKMGIIYPEGNENVWSWKFAQCVAVPEDKRGVVDEKYDLMLDTENAWSYHKTDFLSACKKMGIAKDLKKDGEA
jgi:hypothetical protein